MTLKKLALTTLLCTPLLAVAPTHAQEAGGYAGALIGFAKPNGGLDGGLAYGAEIGLKLDQGFGVGGTFLANTRDGGNVFHYGVNLDYHLTQVAPGLKFGALVGASTAKPDVGSSSTKFMVGPRLGYDFMVNEMFSIGADLSYLITFSDPSLRTFHALASAKYWF